MNTTVLGGYGFIGSYLTSYMQAKGFSCWRPKRDESELYARDLGTVFYCIGLTADFRSRPFETVDAHISILRNLLENASFDKLIYLSSTRVYAGNDVADEELELKVNSARKDELYNLSKLMGESLALSSGRNCQIARISNVYGNNMGKDDFLGSLIHEAKTTGKLVFRTSLNSCKDYIEVGDVVRGLFAIAENGTKPIYNIASGINITHRELKTIFQQFDVTVTVQECSPTIIFPCIKVHRLELDTGWQAKAAHSHLSLFIKNSL